MAKFIKGPAIIRAAGSGEKLISEFFGLVAGRNGDASIAHMISPAGWSEPGQRPDFDEYTVVLKGKLKVETLKQEYLVDGGQAVMAPKNEWVRYSTPEGAEYISVCIPAFSPKTVHRDRL